VTVGVEREECSLLHLANLQMLKLVKSYTESKINGLLISFVF